LDFGLCWFSKGKHLTNFWGSVLVPLSDLAFLQLAYSVTKLNHIPTSSASISALCTCVSITSTIDIPN
jgi:hypothetical protein